MKSEVNFIYGQNPAPNQTSWRRRMCVTKQATPRLVKKYRSIKTLMQTTLLQATQAHNTPS